MNVSNIQYFPRWYIINDLFIALFSSITIIIGMTFVILVIREKKLRTIINILSSNSCLCASLLTGTIIWDVFYMLKCDISGLVRQDRNCLLRNILMLITMIAFNYSICIQTYHRFITIVYSQQTSFRSMKLYIKIIIIQWLISSVLLLPIILSKDILHQTDNFVCQISFSQSSLFMYFFLISYGIPMIFILILHICIGHHMKKYWKSYRQRRLKGSYIVCSMQRIVFLLLIFIISYLPCGIFFILEQLHLSVVPYAKKILLLFASFSFALTMILTFGFNRSVRNSYFRLFHRTNRQNV